MLTSARRSDDPRNLRQRAIHGIVFESSHDVRCLVAGHRWYRGHPPLKQRFTRLGLMELPEVRQAVVAKIVAGDVVELPRNARSLKALGIGRPRQAGFMTAL